MPLPKSETAKKNEKRFYNHLHKENKRLFKTYYGRNRSLTKKPKTKNQKQ